MGEVRINAGVRVPPELKRELEMAAEAEDKSLSKLCEVLLGWAQDQLARAGNSLELKTWRAFPIRSERISDETQEQLYAALATIIERAPSEVLDEVARSLTKFAGRYGDDLRRRRRP